MKFFLFILVGILNFSLFAGESLEYKGSPEDLNTRITSLLLKLDSKYYSDDKTRGFSYRYRNVWYDSFDYDIYIGKVAKNSPDSVLRVESSRRGQERFWRQIFEQEILQKAPKENYVALDKKSLLLSEALNLATPVASVAYNSWNSPIYTTRDTVLSSVFYFALDLVLAGGAYLYAQNKIPKKNLLDNLANVPGAGSVWDGPDALTVITALAVGRGIRAFDAFEDTVSHNKAATLGWKFHF